MVGSAGRTLPAQIASKALGDYGWIQLEHKLGTISMITAYRHTPSVAAVASGLRARGRGATYDATTSTVLAGFTGVQFDGRVVGTNHLFVPFTPPSSAARFLPDGYQLSQGRVFGSSC